MPLFTSFLSSQSSAHLRARRARSKWSQKFLNISRCLPPERYAPPLLLFCLQRGSWTRICLRCMAIYLVKPACSVLPPSPKPSRRVINTARSAPSLVDICVYVIVKNLDIYSSLNLLPNDLTLRILQYLVKKRSLTDRTLSG